MTFCNALSSCLEFEIGVGRCEKGRCQSEFWCHPGIIIFYPLHAVAVSHYFFSAAFSYNAKEGEKEGGRRRSLVAEWGRERERAGKLLLYGGPTPTAAAQ